MSHLSRLQTKITAKTWQAAKKATNLIQNRFALLEGNMTQHDRVVFDLKGYIVKPAVLSESEVKTLKEFVLRQKDNPESLPPHERCLPGGSFAPLIDHPAVMNVLLDVIDPDAGGRTTNPNYAYNFHDGRIYAGMTRVVWELDEVIEDRGGTCFIPGSHKANYNIRTNPVASIDARDSGLWESYGCPPGSLVIFSEAVRHSADFWQNPRNPRVAIFCAYNHINVRHHKPSTPSEVIDRLAPKHQRFFKGVYHPLFD